MASLAIRKVLFAGTALASLTLTQAAHAGGIGIHEQSAAGQGMSFAGQGTSSLGISSMFWNPAAVTQTNGFMMESHTTFLFGNTVITPDPGGLLTLLYGPQNSGNISEFAYIPTTYMAYQLNPNWYVGMSITSPFGSGTHPDTPWAGSFYTK
jgi:long-chain fatty acid transport protein